MLLIAWKCHLNLNCYCYRTTRTYSWHLQNIQWNSQKHCQYLNCNHSDCWDSQNLCQYFLWCSDNLCQAFQRSLKWFWACPLTQSVFKYHLVKSSCPTTAEIIEKIMLQAQVVLTILLFYFPIDNLCLNLGTLYLPPPTVFALAWALSACRQSWTLPRPVYSFAYALLYSLHTKTFLSLLTHWQGAAEGCILVQAHRKEFEGH